MRYLDLSIQTQREAPNNARTPGFAFLVRAGYLTRDSDLLPLGQQAMEHLQTLAERSSTAFFSQLSLPVISNEEETYFPLSTGSCELIHCPACGYTASRELAVFTKPMPPHGEPLPLEKVSTPGCHTIEALSRFLNIPDERTAKALMYTRLSDNKFIFAVLRGDMQLSEAKLKQQVGEIRAATVEEIIASGAEAGYASPVGLRDALIVVDDLIPQTANLVAGANEAGYHLKHVNYGRDFQAELITDLVQTQEGDACAKCEKPLVNQSALLLATRRSFDFTNILLALAESHNDDKGLTLPVYGAPFKVYLMHLPGKSLDTRSAAEALYASLQEAGISVLFDDRDERAGVKFNDADLIGCPVRVTVGERGLQNGMIELKARNSSDNQQITLDKIIEFINTNWGNSKEKTKTEETQ